jgi:phosphoethanolamine N-methyltransferase
MTVVVLAWDQFDVRPVKEGAHMQYSKSFTDALQFMWGAGFLSPGGPEEVDDMLRGQSVAGRRVLDIGSGLGGVDLLLVERHGASEVVGIDVEEQLIEAARELASSAGLSGRIQFQLVEPGPLPFPEASFDVVFSKDAMVHVDDKPALYKEIIRVLKPGGAFLASDWLWAEGAGSHPVVQAWLSKGPLRFVFTTLPEAEAALSAAGFKDVSVEDRRALLQASNRLEVEALEGPARKRLAEIVGEEMAMSRLNGARGRQGALDTGNLIPSHLKATKPA